MMMKPLFIVGTVLLIALSGCEARTPAGSSNSSSGKDPMQQESERTGSSVPEKTQPESNAADTPMDDEFYEQVVLTYGADQVQEESGGSHLILSKAGMFYSPFWENAEELSPSDFYDWYLTTVWKEDLSQEEKRKKYPSPFGENTGWFFPQEQFEPTVQSYFQVSTERLRSDPEVYDAEHQGYYIDRAEMGAGARPLLEIQQVETDESRHKIHIRHYFQEELDVPGVFQGNSVLTILLHEDGTYQYESWQQEEERD